MSPLRGGVSLTPILPTIDFNPDLFAQNMMAALNQAEKVIHEDFEQTTRTWKRQPPFGVAWQLSATVWAVEVFSDNQIYLILNNGAKAHPIAPKNKKALSFTTAGKGSYYAKTTLTQKGRGRISSRRWARVTPLHHRALMARGMQGFRRGSTMSYKIAGEKWGDRVIRAYVAEHPGVKARLWDESIARKRQSWFVAQAKAAMEAAAQASGYAM